MESSGAGLALQRCLELRQGGEPLYPTPRIQVGPPGGGGLTLGKATQHPSAKGKLEWAAVPSKPPKRGSEEYTTTSTTPSSPNAAHPSISHSSLPHSCKDMGYSLGSVHIALLQKSQLMPCSLCLQSERQGSPLLPREPPEPRVWFLARRCPSLSAE